MILSGIRLSRGMHLIQQSAHAVAHADGAFSWKKKKNSMEWKPKSARRQSFMSDYQLDEPTKC